MFADFIKGMLPRLGADKGVSLLELVVTLTILAILASVVMPMAQMTARRTKELELRRNLRTIRTAIDEYKKAWDKMPAGPNKPENESGYPKDLQTLIDGKDFGDIKAGKQKFLRRKIYDPFHPPDSSGDEQWGWELRSYKDKPDSSKWGGEDVFDVFSKSEGTAIDGSKYKDW
jgi:general secretion pathway protein G